MCEEDKEELPSTSKAAPDLVVAKEVANRDVAHQTGGPPRSTEQVREQFEALEVGGPPRSPTEGVQEELEVREGLPTEKANQGGRWPTEEAKEETDADDGGVEDTATSGTASDIEQPPDVHVFGPSDRELRRSGKTMQGGPLRFQYYRERANYVNAPHVICMVGLPARGKTYIGAKLTRYLNWIGINTKVFNAGDYRRRAKYNAFCSHDFFRNDNPEAVEIRRKVAMDCLEDLCTWLDNGGEVGVFDATNSTYERRASIYEYVVKKKGYKLFFVESICDDRSIVEDNIRDVKLSSPDYTGLDADKAVNDFTLRIKHYEEKYKTLDETVEKHLSFMKIFNTGEKVIVHRHEGHIQSRVVYYLMNIHVTRRTIYLTRHGESVMNMLGRIGGDSDLSPRGEKYACSLADYINGQNIPNIRVWTSWFKRTIQTGELIEAPMERWRALNEIDAGICEELTYEEIQQRYPEDFSARDQDKFHYRYPRGESYEDLVGRLEPVIMELERQQNVLVICHQAVLRCLLAYFLEKNTSELPYLKVPLHTIFKLTPVAYGCKVDTIPLNIDCVDTHRPKPEVPGAMDLPPEIPPQLDGVPAEEAPGNEAAGNGTPAQAEGNPDPHDDGPRAGEHYSSRYVLGAF